MIDKWLEKEFKDQLKKPDVDKILWFDQKKEYERLISHLEKEFNILRFDGSLLKMKYELEVKGEGKKWILYLPISQEDAGYLKEYEFTSYILEKSLDSYLSRKGVTFPKGKEEKEAVTSALPLLAERSVGKDKSFWENLSKEKLVDLLFPEFYGEMLELIKTPQSKWKILKKDGIGKLFFAKARKEFGPEPPTGNIDHWVELFLALSFLTEAYVNLGKPEGYPFKNLVAVSKDEEQELIDFLNYWVGNSRYKELFKEKSKEIEAKYNLTNWAKTLPLENEKTFVFVGLAKHTWKAFYEKLKAITAKSEFIECLTSHKDLVKEKSSSFWSEEGEVPGWKVCFHAMEVIEEVATVEKERALANTAEKAFEYYTEEWWKLDKYYRNFKMDLRKVSAAMDSISTWVGKIYSEAIQKLNSRFSETLEKLEGWELKVPRQRDFWREYVEKNEKRLAIFFVDALRFELGKDLETRLSKDYKVKSQAQLAEIPTETNVGMAALLPHDSKGAQIICEEGRMAVKEEESGAIISEKKERKAWIERHFPDVCFAELDELDKPSFKEFKNRLLVLFSVELDALGTALGASALELYDNLLKSLERGVTKVFELGVDEVYIITDHGFLVLEELKDFEKVEIKGQNVLVKSERYAIGKGLEAGNHLKFLINEEEGLEALFPRSTYCFKAPGRYDFLHGGVSLQEVVIPCLIIERHFKPSRVSARIELSAEIQNGIRNQIFKLNLIPEARELFATEARTVRVFCEKGGKVISNEAVEVAKEKRIEVTLRIDPSARLNYGDEITLKAIDDQTLEILDEKRLNVFLVFDIEV